MSCGNCKNNIVKSVIINSQLKWLYSFRKTTDGSFTLSMLRSKLLFSVIGLWVLLSHAITEGVSEESCTQINKGNLHNFVFDDELQ